MWRPGQPPGVLDFQDAVDGPLSYDLVSLLRDCYRRWPDAQLEAWIAHYLDGVRDGGLYHGGSEEFRRWFDLTGVQRHLKAAGIFCRLYHRDGKDGYRGDIPRTLGYVRDVAADWPELRWLGELVDSLGPE